jgi:O-acetyl-ADP-ribose deacetylase (regulator of RNase III)
MRSINTQIPCNGFDLHIVRGDITKFKGCAIVNAANSQLAGGGGVDGAIHAAAGPRLAAASKRFAPIEAGMAVITDSFDLQPQGVRHVVHAVGPRWQGGNHQEAAALAAAYRNALVLANTAGCESIAFPSISTGIYGYPLEQAAPVALQAIERFSAEKARSLREVSLVCFDALTQEAYLEAAGTLLPRRTPLQNLQRWVQRSCRSLGRFCVRSAQRCARACCWVLQRLHTGLSGTNV